MHLVQKGRKVEKVNCGKELMTDQMPEAPGRIQKRQEHDIREMLIEKRNENKRVQMELYTLL